MPLGDVKFKNAKAAAKPMKRFNDKERLLSLRMYPDIGLKDASVRRNEARKLLAHFIDPGLQRTVHKEAKVALASNRFEIVAREWHARYAPVWAEHHGDRIQCRLERDVFPWIGSWVISEVSAPHLLSIARSIEHRGALETVHRALANCGQVFRYAVVTGPPRMILRAICMVLWRPGTHQS